MQQSSVVGGGGATSGEASGCEIFKNSSIRSGPTESDDNMPKLHNDTLGCAIFNF